MKKPAHIERMETELSELVDKFNKLDTFIRSNPVFGGLPTIDQTYIILQSQAMQSYAGLLAMRLERAFQE